MRGVHICVDRLGGVEAAARLVDGQLDDLLIDPPAPRPRIGTVFRGKVARPLKGIGAWLIDLPDGATGFLKGAKALRAGEPILVQVSGFAEPHKALPVTSRLLYKSRYAIATPGAPGINVAKSIEDPEARARLAALGRDAADAAGAEDTVGLILRSAAAVAPDADVARDAQAVLAAAASVAGQGGRGLARLHDGPSPAEIASWTWREGGSVTEDLAAGSFDRAGVREALAALDAPGGGAVSAADMAVEPTRALVAVDVNTGGDGSPAAALKANLAAAKALPRALRLRGLAGQIVIDFAPMTKRDRPRLEQALKAAFRADPVETTLIGWTPLGHFEATRKRERVPLAEVLP